MFANILYISSYDSNDKPLTFNRQGVVLATTLREAERLLKNFTFFKRYLKDLEREQDRVRRNLIPRAGASLVHVNKPRGKPGDPTANAALELTVNKRLKKLERTVAYYKKQVVSIEQFLSGLNDEEFGIINMFCRVDLDALLGDWPIGTHEELRARKKELLKRATKVLSMKP